MGLFMSFSGVIGATSEKIQKVLMDYVAGDSGTFELCDAVTMLGPDTGVITKDLPNTTIIYPGDFLEWDELSYIISDELSVPVFSFHIHDGDFWMYTLFHDGNIVDKFLPVPEYWEELDDEEKAGVKGNAEQLASVIPTLSVDAVKNYLAEWDINCLGESKAYSDDEFAIGDCWQLCDFMKKIGLEYPVDNNGKILGQAFKIINGDEGQVDNSAKQLTKPWWKFW